MTSKRIKLDLRISSNLLISNCVLYCRKHHWPLLDRMMMPSLRSLSLTGQFTECKHVGIFINFDTHFFFSMLRWYATRNSGFSSILHSNICVDWISITIWHMWSVILGRPVGFGMTLYITLYDISNLAMAEF